ncbi:hypothetical protein NI382_06690 [Vibrio parahaemolyticus]|nr:hypothetical protein NI382_06690 [Vibrio parahaemolyticus]
MYEHVNNSRENKNRSISNAVTQKRSAVSRRLELVDNRCETIMQRKSSPVVQFERTVTNRMKENMQESLARVFGGPANRYEIDQESGSTFSDGAPHFTTGHHGVKVTDTTTGVMYSCDFHRDGAYYTRG